MLLAAGKSDSNERPPLSYRIIAAVAEKEGVDPTALEPPEYDSLYDVLNPEALDSLFAPRQNGATRSGGFVEFEYAGYDVTVFSDGTVDVAE
ncbi:hypothetical protein OB919_08250 [Halobacteria archaeon AArc-curdl1]|uniref:Halobacterial output domain-containing protein n=1 Tax=Natronosalvus hydrolyticus TaxID=2979988 RepID=A0AAP2Z827_9EURY|nr:hypothetical protein [Halobacteria archaeon AArc-curdl1]